MSAAKPVMILLGSEEFLRDREKRRLLSLAYQKNYRVVHANTQSDIDAEVSTAGILSIEPIMIVTGFVPDLKDAETVSFLVVLDGDKAPENLPSNAKTVIFTKPTTRSDRRQAAERFCIQEAKRVGVPLAEPDKLAEAIVGLTGDDLGVVSWEVYKASLFARATGSVTITQEIIAQTGRRMGGNLDLSALTNALGRQDGSALAKLLARHGDDATMLLLRAKGGPADAAVLWLRMATATAGKVANADELAGLFGVPAWQVKNRDMPAIRRWGVERLRGLLRAFAELERSIVEGRCPNPWLACQGILLAAVRT